jgi:hypothetical protein
VAEEQLRSTQPWLSVIMPTYNGETVLPRALAGITAQHDNDIEIIAVDDGSTDRTRSILEDFAKDHRTEIIVRSHAGNWVANTNYALSRARGERVCFLHQDDGWLPGRLERLRQVISRYPQAEWLLHPSYYVDRQGRRLGRWTCPLSAGISGPETTVPRLLVQNFISMPGPCVRLEAARAVGGFDETLWYTADWDFWLKLAARGPVAYIPEPLSIFGIDTGSQTVQGARDLPRFQEQLVSVLARHLKEWRARARIARSVERAAHYSVLLNTALAGAISGIRPSYGGLAVRYLALGPAGWFRFLRDSRIFERVKARLRAGLAQPCEARRS